ncbi:MAG: hypothetical protein DBX51_06355 [Clostridiales bacterium]|jgi:hypothetical protein|nr:hypothetical protein [Clostridiales bacterium]PWM40479.1 MAG: hypothetical protein DBX51_06355 [Clostridiales bacterium]
MSDGKMAIIFFEIGLVLTLVSCVLGPFGITGWAIACAVTACFLACAGLFLAMSSWKEPDDPPAEEEKKK